MNKFIKKLLSTLAVGALIAVVALGTNAGLTVSAEEGTSLAEKQYVPDKFDFVDFYGAVGDIEKDKGDGVTTFAHAGLITPLNASNIKMNTSFNLLSKKTVAEGGDDVDGWLTYSFSKTPADKQSDNTIPSYANGTDEIVCETGKSAVAAKWSDILDKAEYATSENGAANILRKGGYTYVKLSDEYAENIFTSKRENLNYSVFTFVNAYDENKTYDVELYADGKNVKYYNTVTGKITEVKASFANGVAKFNFKFPANTTGFFVIEK